MLLDGACTSVDATQQLSDCYTKHKRKKTGTTKKYTFRGRRGRRRKTCVIMQIDHTARYKRVPPCQPPHFCIAHLQEKADHRVRRAALHKIRPRLPQHAPLAKMPPEELVKRQVGRVALESVQGYRVGDRLCSGATQHTKHTKKKKKSKRQPDRLEQRRISDQKNKSTQLTERVSQINCSTLHPYWYIPS